MEDIVRSMEIVHVVRQYAPSVGGLEDAVANLCQNLALMPDVRVRVVTLDRIFASPDKVLPASETIEGIEVTRLAWFGSRRYPVAPGVLRAIKGADIVHVHAIDWFFDFLALMRPLHGKVLIASTHGGFFHTSFASRLKKIYFQTVTRVSSLAYKTICASSENDAANFRRIAGNKVVAIENGVNVEKWQRAGSSVLLPSLAFIGRWSSNKRVPALIALLAALRRAGTPWTLHIIGLAADETIDSLRAFAGQHGVAEAVHIHVAPSQEEIRHILSRCSYIASASSYEGFGISIVEGLSAGLLPILSKIPPFERLSQGLGFGARIDPADIAVSVANIGRLHEEAKTGYSTMRDKAMTVSQSYAWQSVVNAFMQVYHRALERT